jgi:hypothetical protein
MCPIGRAPSLRRPALHDLAAALAAAWQLAHSGDPTLVGIVSLCPASASRLFFSHQFSGCRPALDGAAADGCGIVRPCCAIVFWSLREPRAPFHTGGYGDRATVLVTPIVAAIARQIVEDLWGEYSELYIFDGVGRVRSVCSVHVRCSVKGIIAARRSCHAHPQCHPPRVRSSHRHPRHPTRTAPRPRSARPHAHP